MLDHLKAQLANSGRRETTRWAVLVAASVAVAGAVLSSRSCHRDAGTSQPATEYVAPPVEPGAEPLTVIDRQRFRAVGDGPGVHQDVLYEKGALDYALSLTRVGLAEVPRPIGLAELAALPFADVAGRVFEVTGRVTDLVQQEFREPRARLWSLVVEAEGGARAVVLKHGYATDADGGAPRGPRRGVEEAVVPGETIAVRGIWLQRRTGTVGRTALGEPTPVLVALKFRKTEPATTPVEEPAEADWREVKDRFLRDTQRWEEPALFQVMQWARAKGVAEVRRLIETKAIPVRHWGREAFDTWVKEIQVTKESDPRPFTESARGGLWSFDGIVGRVLFHGWEEVPPNPNGIDHLYNLDLSSDDYSVMGTGIALRCPTVFPLDAFPGVTGQKMQQIRAYGFFLKNFTYTHPRPSARTGKSAEVTVPMFVVVHAEPIVHERDDSAMWWIAGSMLVVGLLFWLVLVRGEAKEAKRQEERRIALRRRMRSAGQGPMAGTMPPPRGSEPPSEDGG